MVTTTAKFWAGYLERALRSWGLATIILLSITGSAICFTHQRVGMIVDNWLVAKIEVEKSNAAAMRAVAEAVTKLADVSDKTINFQNMVSDEHRCSDQKIDIIIMKLDRLEDKLIVE